MSKDNNDYVSRFGFVTSDDVRTGYISGQTFTNLPVQYCVVDGVAIFEGCIELGTVEQMDRNVAAVRAGGMAEPVKGLEKGIGITGAQYRWPSALMPYTIASTLPNQSRVTDAVAHWEANTKMSFVQRTSANASQYPNYVEFIPGSGCSSAVGMQGGRQVIRLASGCSTGNTIHEIGHAWGLWHEQSREDRDSFVRINWQNIQAGKEHNFTQHITDGDDIGPYDYGSIMHYPTHAFSKNGQSTIDPLQSGVTIGQRTALSAGDIAAVHAMYQLWYYNVNVQLTYASKDSQNAWAYIQGLGWRRVNPGATDGVTNIFLGLAEAQANNRKVDVLADGGFVYRFVLK